MLVDDDVADQAKARRHVKIANAVRFLARSAHQHGLAHDGSACGRTRHHAAAQVEAADHPFHRRVTDLTGYAQLIPAGEEDRSEERRVGKACVSTCKSRWSPSN